MWVSPCLEGCGGMGKRVSVSERSLNAVQRQEKNQRMFTRSNSLLAPIHDAKKFLTYECFEVLQLTLRGVVGIVDVCDCLRG